MKRFATLTVITLTALEMLLSVVFLGGWATPDRTTAVTSTIVLRSDSPGVQ